MTAETATAPTDAVAPKKRGRKARADKTPDDFRLKAVPVWVDDNVQVLSKGFDEKDKWIYTAAMLHFSELDSEKQLALIGKAKILNKDVVKAVSDSKSTATPVA